MEPTQQPSEKIDASLRFDAIVQNLRNCNAALNIDHFLRSENIALTSEGELALEEPSSLAETQEPDLSWLTSANDDSASQQKLRTIVQGYLGEMQPDRLVGLQTQAKQAEKDAKQTEEQLKNVVQDIQDSALLEDKSDVST